MSGTPTVTLLSLAPEHHPASFRFDGFVEEITARTPEEVIPALKRVEEAAAQGLHAAGFVSYEAAAGLGTGLATHSPGPLPLVWFGVFENRLGIAPRLPSAAECGVACGTSGWETTLSPEAYQGAVERTKEYIAAGDTYQVNFTFSQRFAFTGNPAAYFGDLCRAQNAPFCAHLDTGRFQILSASPELFFELRHGVLTCRPMKGTATRGRWRSEDEQIKARLAESEKERAENLMITDLLRNDLGMVAKTGSVQVDGLFAVETLETVHQMTSTITARQREGVDLPELFRALFPCGSVTGAPKKRSMEIIRELEDSPRGVYTGCIGHVSPGGEMTFSVAIRTVVVDTETGRGELGIGSGVTIGSQAEDEYQECLAKARFARERMPDFQLVETMLHEEDKGCFLLDRHLARLFRSAAYFGFTVRLGTITMVLAHRTGSLEGKHKVRLLLNRRGAFTIETEPLPPTEGVETMITCFASEAVESADPFLYHKTTHRPLYMRERERHPDCDDVIFVNERGEVTEATTANVVARIGGTLVTPPLPCGLLPGTFREEILALGQVRERVITREELEGAEDIYLVNSVRQWRWARLT
ncbi:para-aminobenzoate synthase, subunit I [Geobacter metallireducens RCH3]|uniref:Pyridoxal-5'-phosphate-dependent chorismate-binding enzyme, putative n=1 Tax=Geobacter metallireducens (strain ATCC 53774 / DSM 7210 / GS-15) TaxID=269799 RepID=Q39R99_GEOMG|nr:aminodeoxychorismate synthase component I [Geobacter metallireducens]ABB33225.1 pyridoxal-5'-phosphate-dependent chorismate-binding enzyme, putative [Geobacter metallireducens GS-15]EHP84659.1 para-aminobenzoate synthase, subunit I [Geobacter metallireducens RCH3]